MYAWYWQLTAFVVFLGVIIGWSYIGLQALDLIRRNSAETPSPE